MKLWQQYLRPKSITEALQMLESPPGPACLIAGGTDLILEIQQGRHAPVHTLVDLSEISEMTALEIRNGQLFIGAAVPISRIALSDLTREHAQALVDACNLIGGPQVRNMATLGGNVAHALPAADGTIALLAQDARAEIADSRKRRRVPLATLFVGPGQSSLSIGREILVGFSIPLKTPQQGSVFKRIMRDQGIALPILNLAVWLERKLDQIADVRIAVGPSGPTPQRITAAENVLRKQSLTPEACNKALASLLNQVDFRTSPYRASKEYRQELVGVLLREALDAAWQRANS
jgi:CO/xanthine dehydrogenase FAD-binding subunit